jgi:hypothetical protein
MVPMAVRMVNWWSAAAAALLSWPALAQPVATIPDDEALEAAHARIGTISIQVHQIFDTSDPREDKWLYREANRWHYRTRDSAVRAQLLFRSGELYSAALLRETERNMRQLQFVREPKIRPIAYHDGVVDILVETHDVWTLEIGPSFGRAGGANSGGFDFSDDDFLGTGQKFQLGRSSNVDRSSTYLNWYDPTVFGSRWTAALAWADNSDGYVHSVAGGLPFYSLETRHSLGIIATDIVETDSRYDLGTYYDDYQHRSQFYDLNNGWSGGLVDDHADRLLVGWRVQHDDFAAATDGTTIGPVPANRNLNFPYVSFGRAPSTYDTTRNYDQIERTEDLQFGFAGTLLLGWINTAFGADRDAGIFSGQLADGWRLTPAQNVFAAATIDGRLQNGAVVDLRTTSSLTWYWRTSAHTLLNVRVAAAGGQALDLDHYIDLGGDDGLRGYPLRYQLGTGDAQFKIEERLYTPWSLWRLLDVGGAVFFDGGRVWGGNPIGVPDLGWLKDAGIGLRLGNNRSSLGDVIHIDLATPLDGRNLSRLQVLVSTQATF